MNLAFCLYKYFPYGGLQRDFLRIAKACVDRGHQVHAYCLSWQGEQPEWLTVTKVPVRALTNPGRYRKFSRWLQAAFKTSKPDLVVGFNKMPGLDVYYAADPCYQHKARKLRRKYYQYSPRYRHFARYERAVFGSAATTEILLISETQKALFQRYYQTPDQRLHLLPPGVDRSRKAPANAAEVRTAFRREFALAGDDLLLLMVGSGFRTKGVDRALEGLAALPEALRDRTRLFVIGEDNSLEFQLLARTLGIYGQVRFFKGRDDISRFLQGADLLIHPAYSENTGTVLLEAVVAGLPVLVTDVCGYAHYVADADAGELVASPFSQETFNNQLRRMLQADKTRWRENALRYAETADIYDMPVKAAELIEAAAGGEAQRSKFSVQGSTELPHQYPASASQYSDTVAVEPETQNPEPETPAKPA